MITQIAGTYLGSLDLVFIYDRPNPDKVEVVAMMATIAVDNTYNLLTTFVGSKIQPTLAKIDVFSCLIPLETMV